MTDRVTYRDVVFSVHAKASTHKGHTVVRPIAVVGVLGNMLSGVRDVPLKCVGRAFKVEGDKNSDDFGVRLAVYRSYRMVVGLAKGEVQKVMKACDGMQKECKADQNKLHDKQYPKSAFEASLPQK